MEDASEGDLLLEGQCEQPSASWLALNIPAGQAGTQRDHLRISGIAAVRGLSLELKSKRFCPTPTKKGYGDTHAQNEHFRFRKYLFNTSNSSNILSEKYLPGTNGLSHLSNMNNDPSLSRMLRDLIGKMNLMCSSASGT